MFRYKPKPGSLLREGHAEATPATPKAPQQPTPQPPRTPTPPIGRPAVRHPHSLIQHASPPPQPAAEEDEAEAPVALDERRDEKRLIVGRGIVLKGEITACDRLVVEGTVEASLTDSDTVIIAESGRFEGDAEINEADISGVFQGKLIVRGRLLVRGGGRVNGEVRYGELEVETGGRLTGDVQAGDAEAGDRRDDDDVEAPVSEAKTAAAR